jgi:hypothetical protein
MHSKKNWHSDQIYLATSSTHVQFYSLILYIVKKPFNIFSFRFRMPHTCRKFVDLRCVKFLGLNSPLMHQLPVCQSVNHLKAMFSILFILCLVDILLKWLHRLLLWTFQFYFPQLNLSHGSVQQLWFSNSAHHPTPQKGVTIIRIT